MSNSLASVHPELIPEWSERNLPLTPDKITFGSNKRVWWKGACGHEWETSVKARSKGEKCPICSGARVIEGINDLATLKPLLAQEWSEKNELKPTEVSVASHKKIIWKCKHGHEWEASVKSRTVNGTGCPYCSHNKVLAGFNDLASQYGKPRRRSCNIPYFNLVVDGFEHSRKIKAVKKSLCNQNGITYCEINSKDPFAMAAQIKALFRKNHVYITSENENDIRFCRNLFFSVKHKNARTS